MPKNRQYWLASGDAYKLLLAVQPFDVLGFDYMGPFPSTNGYTHIMFAVDYVTK